MQAMSLQVDKDNGNPPASNGPVAPEVFNQELQLLFQRIAEQDESALAALYERTSKLVFGLLLRMLKDTATAQEVLVNAYTQLLRRGALYDYKRSTALAWLISIVRSCAMEKLLSESASQEPVELPEPLNLASSQVANYDEYAPISVPRKLVWSILDKLSTKQRQVVELAYFSCLSQSEIAEQLGQPVELVKMHLHAGMLKLRDQLKLARGVL
jgi:RNA polymerase sigma-70 factor (ECF subfamily)